MKTYPLVSIITPTWGRPDTLINNCLPCVARQVYQNIEHIIVVDGYDQQLIRLLREKGYAENNRFRRIVWLGRNTFDGYAVGAFPRMVGTYMARGEFICYLDDDNIWDPLHVEKLASFLVENPEAMIVGSEWLALEDGRVRGRPSVFWYEQVDASSFMHRRELLNISNWQSDGYECDRNVVKRWLGDRGEGWHLSYGVTMIAPAARKGTADGT